MDDFSQEELRQFIAELNSCPGTTPSMGTRYARESGYISRFIPYFDPFQYEHDVDDAVTRLPGSGDLLAVVYPKDRYSVRFFRFRRGTRGEAAMPFNRKMLTPLQVSHPGYEGLRGDQELELAYQKNPAARRLFEKALSLTAATALYRSLRLRPGRLYWMEKGWGEAYQLCPAEELTCRERLARSGASAS